MGLPRTRSRRHATSECSIRNSRKLDLGCCRRRCFLRPFGSDADADAQTWVGRFGRTIKSLDNGEKGEEKILIICGD